MQHWYWQSVLFLDWSARVRTLSDPKWNNELPKQLSKWCVLVALLAVCICAAAVAAVFVLTFSLTECLKRYILLFFIMYALLLLLLFGSFLRYISPLISCGACFLISFLSASSARFSCKIDYAVDARASMPIATFQSIHIWSETNPYQYDWYTLQHTGMVFNWLDLFLYLIAVFGSSN